VTRVRHADRQVEYLDLGALIPAVRNPKAHAHDTLRASISRFGFTAPALLDERTGRLVAGHGRTQALAAMRAAGEHPPAGVQVGDGGAWLVPVVRGWASRSDAEADAYLVADNQLTIAGWWDEAALTELLTELAATDPDLTGLLGFTEEQLAGMLAAEPTPEARHGDPDDAPPLPAAEPVTRPGDVWLLGPHRLVCGDATDAAAAHDAVDGGLADCMWTDPPYGVTYTGVDTTPRDALAGDTAPALPQLLADAFTTATYVLHPGAAVYVAHAPGPLSADVLRAMTGAGWAVRQQLVWCKNHFVLGHGDYHYQHEPVWAGYTGGAEGRPGRGGPGWHGGDAQTSTFHVDRPARSDEHPTMKPTALVAAMLTNSCPPGGLVYDPFAGSGSTLVAADDLGMRCAAIELEPRYCDVVCRRWQARTGGMPTLAATGTEVDFAG
jgi:DNA modification methylase